MYRRSHYSRRVIEKRQRRLQRSEKTSNDLDLSSASEDESQAFERTRSSMVTTSNIFPVVIEQLSGYDDYYGDEHDNTGTSNDIRDNYPHQSLPLYDGSKLSVVNAMKSLMDILISDINLDKENVLRLLKFIKSILPEPNNLPTTWKSIMKLFGGTSISNTMFLCSFCESKCDKSAFGAKVCRNEACSHSNVTLKTHQIVELVNLDIRTQLKTIVTRNFNLISKNADFFPQSDISNADFYRTSLSESKCNTITLIIHSDGAPLIRTTKQSIWPLFASIVEIPPPVREYQRNIVLLGLWSSKIKPNPNLFLKHAM